MRKEMNVKWYSDAGHEWLGVHGNALAFVGLREKDLSPYSYRFGSESIPDLYFLEGDCDAAFFIEYAAKAGWTLKYETEKVYGEENPIRKLPRIRGESLI